MKQEIKMLPDLMNNIREGKKFATCRMGVKSYSLGPVTFVNSNDPNERIDGFNIWEVKALRLENIDKKISLLEGYEHPEDLKDKLVEIYGNITPHDILTFVYFHKEDLI